MNNNTLEYRVRVLENRINKMMYEDRRVKPNLFSKRIEDVKAAVERGDDLSVTNSKGYTPLIAAIANKENLHDIVKYLLENGADPNAYYGATKVRPLHCAIKFGKLDDIRELIKHGADLFPYNEVFGSPLYYAMKFYNCYELMSAMLDSNDIIDKNGYYHSGRANDVATIAIDVCRAVKYGCITEDQAADLILPHVSKVRKSGIELDNQDCNLIYYGLTYLKGSNKDLTTKLFSFANNKGVEPDANQIKQMLKSKNAVLKEIIEDSYDTNLSDSQIEKQRNSKLDTTRNIMKLVELINTDNSYVIAQKIIQNNPEYLEDKRVIDAIQNPENKSSYTARQFRELIKNGKNNVSSDTYDF